MPSTDKRPSVVYPDDDATVVTDLNLCAERERTMRRSHAAVAGIVYLYVLAAGR